MSIALIFLALFGLPLLGILLWALIGYMTVMDRLAAAIALRIRHLFQKPSAPR